MNRRTLLWLVVFLFGAAGLSMNAFLRPHGFGKAYVHDTTVRRVEVTVAPPIGADAGEAAETKWVAPDDSELEKPNVSRTATPEVSWVQQRVVPPAEAWKAMPSDPSYRFSAAHTLGLWMAAIFTLATLSFVWKDNPVYKFTEAVIVGVSAAYWMINALWATLVPQLVEPLFPATTKELFMPGAAGVHSESWFITLVPAALALMLLTRLLPRGSRLATWPLAFVIGTTAGMKLLSHVQADFLAILSGSVLPLYAKNASGGFDWGTSLGNMVLVGGLLSVLTYFFFSVEHRGPVGKVARVGVWFLMISFGAAFAFTVMGRIALLSERFEFLFDQWLWLIDPQRAHSEVISAIAPVLHIR